MEKKVLYSIFLYIFLILVLTIIIYYGYKKYSSINTINITFVSKEQSEKIAENFVKNSYRFYRYQGKNLKLMKSEDINCESCYRFSYSYDSNLNDLFFTVKGFETLITIVEGKISTIETYEISANNSRKIIGGDTDEHDCIPSAGYIWCELKQKCIRSWEEEC